MRSIDKPGWYVRVSVTGKSVKVSIYEFWRANSGSVQGRIFHERYIPVGRVKDDPEYLHRYVRDWAKRKDAQVIYAPSAERWDPGSNPVMGADT